MGMRQFVHSIFIVTPHKLTERNLGPNKLKICQIFAREILPTYCMIYYKCKHNVSTWFSINSCHSYISIIS